MLGCTSEPAYSATRVHTMDITASTSAAASTLPQKSTRNTGTLRSPRSGTSYRTRKIIAPDLFRQDLLLRYNRGSAGGPRGGVVMFEKGLPGYDAWLDNHG